MGAVGPSRILARLASLAQIGELARRLLYWEPVLLFCKLLLTSKIEFYRAVSRRKK